MNYRPCPQCGQPATEHLSLPFRYPRNEYTPQAMDPWYVNGHASMTTCGSAACEAAELLRHRAELISYNREYGWSEDVEIFPIRPEDERYHVACGDHFHTYTAEELKADINKQCDFGGEPA